MVFTQDIEGREAGKRKSFGGAETKLVRAGLKGSASKRGGLPKGSRTDLKIDTGHDQE